MSTELDIQFENDGGSDKTVNCAFITYGGEITTDILNKVLDEVLESFDTTLSLDYYIAFQKPNVNDTHKSYGFIELAHKLGRIDDIRERVNKVLQ